MAYKGKTDFYGIPFPLDGDFIESAEEAKRMNIIENQLLASNRGIKSCIFEDGEYHLIDNVNGTYTVMLSNYGSRDAIEGILNGGYVWSNKNILWENLKKGYVKYLYIKWTPNLFQNESSFLVEVSDVLYQNSKFHLLMAIFNGKDTPPTLDTNPDQKLYGTDVTYHIGDKKNPHGFRFEQDELVILDKLKVKCEDKELELQQWAGKQIKELNGISAGKEGVKFAIPEAKKIIKVFVDENVVNIPTFKLGEIAIRNDSVNQFTVFNNGEVGINLRITVLYEE